MNACNRPDIIIAAGADFHHRCGTDRVGRITESAPLQLIRSIMPGGLGESVKFPAGNLS
jgi:hypothetical protein